MSHPQDFAELALAGRPYGLLGLVLSTFVILLATALVCVLAAAVLFGIAGLIFGWQPVVNHFIDLDSSGGSDVASHEKLTIAISVGIYSALSVVVVLAARLRAGSLWRDLVAWRRFDPLHGAGWVWAVAFLMLLYSFGADAVITRLSPQFKDLVHMPQGTRWVVLFVLLASLFAPIAEELLFRGWLYTSLRASFGVSVAVLVSSALFGLAHWEGTHLYALAVFPVGLGLAYVRERTGSIAASICVHGFYNGVASALLFFAR